MTSPVTVRPKRYVYVCAGCGLLEVSERSDALTCSARCRVRAHRNAKLRRLRVEAASVDITPASVLQTQAALYLCPHLEREIRNKRIKLDDTRAEVWAACWARITQALGYLEQTEKDAQLTDMPPDEP